MRIIGLILICAANQVHGGRITNILKWMACKTGWTTEGCPSTRIAPESSTIGFLETKNMLSEIRRGVHAEIMEHDNLNHKETLNGHGTFLLVDRIAYDTNLIVFTASESQLPDDPRFIIKYFDFCRPGDVLVDEFAITKVIYDLQKRHTEFPAVPEMIGISSPFVPDESGSEHKLDTSFAIIDEDWCLVDQKRARFIVEQRVGDSFKRFPSHEFDPEGRLIIAIRVFQEGVKLLESVHQLGIIHGDIHPGNIALRDYKVPTIEQLRKLISGKFPANWLVLIDFGKGRFIPEIDRRTKRLAPDLTLSILSPWHLQGGPIGCRDDIFRLFEFLLNLATDNKLAAYYWTMDNHDAKLSPAQMAKVKLKQDLVKKSGIVATDPGYKILLDLLNLVRGKHTAVNYEELIAKAQLLIDQLSRKTDSFAL